MDSSATCIIHIDIQEFYDNTAGDILVRFMLRRGPLKQFCDLTRLYIYCYASFTQVAQYFFLYSRNQYD